MPETLMILLYICFGLITVFSLIKELKKTTEKPVLDFS